MMQLRHQLQQLATFFCSATDTKNTPHGHCGFYICQAVYPQPSCLTTASPRPERPQQSCSPWDGYTVIRERSQVALSLSTQHVALESVGSVHIFRCPSSLTHDCVKLF